MGALIAITASSSVFAVDPNYVFKLTEDHAPDLCAHMTGVFATKFQHMWTAPAKGLDADYSNNSAYAFAMRPTVAHDSRMTFEMRYSKLPSSPEFDAIEWEEGHAVFGGGVGDASTINNSLVLPYLIAYFDIDNDGIPDTVVKEGFSKGYRWMTYRGAADAGNGETLVTYRNQKLDPSPCIPLSDFIRGADGDVKPLYISGDYIRPFIFQAKTYVARYKQGFDETPTKQSRDNLKRHLPPHEQMVVSSFAYKGALDALGRPKLSEEALCRFDMIQLSVYQLSVNH